MPFDFFFKEEDGMQFVTIYRQKEKNDISLRFTQDTKKLHVLVLNKV